jgi:hypothetical protein
MSTVVHHTVAEASAHLYEALTHHVGNMDLGAHDPLVRAISEYGQKCRERDEDAIHRASEHVYEALTHHRGNRDVDAHDPLVKALADFGDACRAEGPKK